MDIINDKQNFNPWKDVASYNITDADSFKGREEEILKFCEILESGKMAVLYSDSGIGKTSFLNAGISSKFIKEGFYPIRITFIDEIFSESNMEHIEKWIIERLIDFFENKEIDNSKKPLASELKNPQWVYALKDQIHNPQKSLWWFLHTYKMKDVDTGKEYRPLIIFDQFEEVFSKTGDNSKRSQLTSLFAAIEDIASDAVPSIIDKELEKLENEGIYINLESESNYKIIFSLRKEYLADFDYWTNKQYSISELYRNRMLLLPLTREQAENVITRQPNPYNMGSYIDELTSIKMDILDKIDANNKNEIEPIMLSVLCSRLYEEAKSRGIHRLTTQDVAIRIDTLLSQFYIDTVSDIFNDSFLLSEFERQILDASNHRNRIRSKLLLDGRFDELHTKRIGDKTITTSYKKELEDKHIIRVEKYNGEDYVELIHDRIAEVVSNRNEIKKRLLANLKKIKSKYNLLTISGRRLMDNCGFDFTEDNNRTIISGNSKSQLKDLSLNSIHSREYDGSDNVFVADILNQIVGSDKLFLHFGGNFTKDGFRALGINTILINSQRIINGIEFYDSQECKTPISSAEGFDNINIDYDSNGQEKVRIYTNSNKTGNVSGVTKYEIVEYDEYGFPLKILFKDDNNQLCKHFDGNYGIEFKYDKYGNEIYRRYLAIDGHSSCKIYNQVCGLMSEYDEKKDRVTLQYFVDEHGKITNDVYGIVGVKYFYDDASNDISRMEYIGKDRNICINPYGYSVVKFIYKNGKRFQYRYLSSDNITPVSRIDGDFNYSILEMEYDQCDRIICYKLRDIEEKIKFKIIYNYDNIGRVSEIKYYAGDNSIIASPSGVHHIKYEYYENGLLKCQSHFGINNTIVEDKNGNHKAIVEWDTNGRLHKRSFFKANQEKPHNTQIFEYISEAHCLVTDTTYTDSKGNYLDKPLETQQEWKINQLFQAQEIIFNKDNGFIPDRLVKVKYKYNIAGDVIEYRFFDPNSDDSIPDENGNYGYRFDLNNDTGEDRTIILDAYGNEILIIVRNNILYQGEEYEVISYFNEKNEPILCEYGYHKVISSRPVDNDELNKKLEYFDCENNRCNCLDGYSRQLFWEEEIEDCNEIRRIVSFLSADGSPCINKARGYHKREQIFSKDENMEICRLFRNEKGDLVNVKEGFAKLTCKRYDSFWTLLYYPFEDHDVVRFYDENDQKVDVDFNINGKIYHAYKYICTESWSSFFKVTTAQGKTLYRDWRIIWKYIFIVVIPLAFVIFLISYPIYKLIKKIFNIFNYKRTIHENTGDIIQIVQVYNEVQNGNDSIVSPAKSMGIKEGYWIVRWNDWEYNKDDAELIEKFEKEFNASSELKIITLYDSIEKRFFNLSINEKNLGVRIQNVRVPEESITKMLELDYNYL